MIWLFKAWAWLKKNWKYILFPVGILIGLATLLGRRKVVVVAPELVEAEEVRRRADQEAAVQVELAKRNREREVKRIEKEHVMTIAKLTRKQRDELEALREDPDELNSFLLQVGEDIRGQSR